MITARAPCPICGKPVKVERFLTGWTVGCVGDDHAVSLYRRKGPDQAAEAWDKLFLVEEVPVQ